LFTRGEPLNGDCRDPRIAADGRTVVFTSSSTNLVDAPDANGGAEDVFSADVVTMAVTQVSVASGGPQTADGSSFAPAVSRDARYVAFSSSAPLDGARSPATSGRARVEVYWRDTRLGLTTRISRTPEGGGTNGSSYDAAISADGRFVAFVSDATNLTRQRDRNAAADIYVHDTVAGTTALASRNDRGRSANGPSRRPALSGDGSVLVFQSDASDLACGVHCGVGDINLVSDIFALDRVSGAIRRVSAGRTVWMDPSIGPAVDGTGRVIAFSSRRARHARDDRDDYDLFVSRAGRGEFPR
jgi:Tol biopolymer transport system component